MKNKPVNHENISDALSAFERGDDDTDDLKNAASSKGEPVNLENINEVLSAFETGDGSDTDVDLKNDAAASTTPNLASKAVVMSSATGLLCVIACLIYAGETIVAAKDLPPTLSAVIPSASTEEMQKANCAHKNPLWFAQRPFYGFPKCQDMPDYFQKKKESFPPRDPRAVPWQDVCDQSGRGECLVDKDDVTRSGMGYVCVCNQDTYCSDGCIGLQRPVPIGLNGNLLHVDTGIRPSFESLISGSRSGDARSGAATGDNSDKSAYTIAKKKINKQLDDDIENFIGVFSGKNTCTDIPKQSSFKPHFITTLAEVPKFQHVDIGELFFANPGLIRGECGPLQPTLAGGDLAADGNNAQCREMKSQLAKCNCGLALNVKTGWFGEGLNCLPSSDFIPVETTYMGCANSELRSRCKAADLHLNDETGTTDLFNLKNVNVRSAPHNQWIANQIWPKTLAKASPLHLAETVNAGTWSGPPQTTGWNAGEGSGAYVNNNVQGGQCTTGTACDAEFGKTGEMWLSGKKLVVCCPGEVTNPFLSSGLGYFGVIAPELHNGGRNGQKYSKGVPGVSCDRNGCTYHPQCACPVAVPSMDLKATGPPTKLPKITVNAAEAAAAHAKATSVPDAGAPETQNARIVIAPKAVGTGKFVTYAIFVGNPDSLHLGKHANLEAGVKCKLVNIDAGVKDRSRWNPECDVTGVSGRTHRKGWTVAEAPSLAEQGPYDSNRILVTPHVHSGASLHHGTMFVGTPGLIYAQEGAKGYKRIDSKVAKAHAIKMFDLARPSNWTKVLSCPLGRDPTTWNVANDPFDFNGDSMCCNTANSPAFATRYHMVDGKNTSYEVCYCGSLPVPGAAVSYKCFPAKLPLLRPSHTALNPDEVDWNLDRYSGKAKALFAIMVVAAIIFVLMFILFTMIVVQHFRTKRFNLSFAHLLFFLLLVFSALLGFLCLAHLPGREMPRSEFISTSDESYESAALKAFLAGGEGIWY